MQEIFEKPVDINVNGTVYKLVFTHRAMAHAEKVTGHNLLQWQLLRWSRFEMSTNDLVTMLYACLIKYHSQKDKDGKPVEPFASLDLAYSILDAVGLEVTFTAVVEAWQAAQPRPKPEDPNGLTAPTT